MALSALAGLALTYYYDNPRNAKLMTILQARHAGLSPLTTRLQSGSRGCTVLGSAADAAHALPLYSNRCSNQAGVTLSCRHLFSESLHRPHVPHRTVTLQLRAHSREARCR